MRVSPAGHTADPAVPETTQQRCLLFLYSTCWCHPQGWPSLAPSRTTAISKRHALAQSNSACGGTYLSRGLLCSWRRRSYHTRRRARRSCQIRSRSRSTGCSCTGRARCTAACPLPPGTGSGTRSGSPLPGTHTWYPGSRGCTHTGRRRKSRCCCTWCCRVPARHCSRTCSCR